MWPPICAVRHAARAASTFRCWTLTREPCAESVSIFREAGEQLNLAMALHNLGNVLHALGDDGAAFALYQEAIPLFQQRAYMRGLWISLDDLAAVAHARGQHARAVREWVFGMPWTAE